MNEFRVQIDGFSGPLDLLLYLVRKHELDVLDIPVALVTDQYLQFVDVLEELDVDTVADFLDVASLLIEIKSRMVLPRPEEIDEPEVEDPRDELVTRLLEFKKYRDAAQLLDERRSAWRDRFARRATASASRGSDAIRPVTGVELWDLVSAFGRVIRGQLPAPTVDAIRYDDTPIHVFMQRIYQRLLREPQVEFLSLFESDEGAGLHKSTLVGMFLAVLELIRYRHAVAEQTSRFGEIWLKRGDCPYTPHGKEPAPLLSLVTGE